MFTKYAAPVAALAASVAAQSSCTFSATTVSAANDAVTSCTSISGDVHFAQGAANPMVTLAAKNIDGKLFYDSDSSVTGFSAPNLSSVGDVAFTNLSSLSTISLNSLVSSGDFEITGCGGLGTVTTGSQYQKAGTVTVANTQLQALDAFSTLSMISGLNVQGNSLLANITMNIGSVGTIDVGNNEVQNQGLTVAFDNLTMAQNITVRNASTVSLSSLQGVSGALGMYSNTFESFQVPNLTYAGIVTLQSNNKLTNISFPSLTTINQTGSASFTVLNNTALQSVGGWPQLTSVKGAVTFIGAFSNVTDISQLKEVDGTMKVSSTQDITGTVCNEVKSLYQSQVLRASPTCLGKAANPASTNGGSSSGSGSGSGSTSSAAAGNVDIPALPTLSMGLGAFLLQFLLSF